MIAGCGGNIGGGDPRRGGTGFAAGRTRAERIDSLDCVVIRRAIGQAGICVAGLGEAGRYGGRTFAAGAGAAVDVVRGGIVAGIPIERDARLAGGGNQIGRSCRDRGDIGDISLADATWQRTSQRASPATMESIVKKSGLIRPSPIVPIPSVPAMVPLLVR
jgi:hypothetical protein